MDEIHQLVAGDAKRLTEALDEQTLLGLEAKQHEILEIGETVDNLAKAPFQRADCLLPAHIVAGHYFGHRIEGEALAGKQLASTGFILDQHQRHPGHLLQVAGVTGDLGDQHIVTIFLQHEGGIAGIGIAFAVDRGQLQGAAVVAKLADLRLQAVLQTFLTLTHALTSSWDGWRRAMKRVTWSASSWRLSSRPR